LLHFGEQLRANASPLVLAIDDDPVEIVRRFRTRVGPQQAYPTR